MKKALLIFAAVLQLMSVSGQNLRVDVTGDAVFSNTAFTISEAGEDFSASAFNEKTLFVNVVLSDNWAGKGNPRINWSISMHKSDINWHSNLILETKRNGNGENIDRKGQAKINDGMNYQSVSNNPTYFFSGQNEIVNIPLKVKLRGISIVMGANDFETNIMLTVYEN